MEEFKGIFSDEKHKNDCTTAPPSGRVRSLHNYAHMMPYLYDTTFTRAIFTCFDEIFSCLTRYL